MKVEIFPGDSIVFLIYIKAAIFIDGEYVADLTLSGEIMIDEYTPIETVEKIRKAFPYHRKYIIRAQPKRGWILEKMYIDD